MTKNDEKNANRSLTKLAVAHKNMVISTTNTRILNQRKRKERPENVCKYSREWGTCIYILALRAVIEIATVFFFFLFD